MTDLIIAIDDKFDDAEAATLSPSGLFVRARVLLLRSCDSFTGLKTPVTGRPIQLKLNTLARVLGHECFEIIEDAGLEAFADYKIGNDVLDTLWADIRALRIFSCIKRLTFRVECPVEFLSGAELKGERRPGARELMPQTSFLPVGPVTDLRESYYADRMGLKNGRAEAMMLFGDDVEKFGPHVVETICGPVDIAHFKPSFWTTHSPITPAVRPIGLQGNEANNLNAFNVEKAIKAGSKGLVIGSPIMGSGDQRKAAQLVLDQMAEATVGKIL